MTDERTEVKVPNLLTPEVGRVVEVSQEVASDVETSRREVAEAASEQPPANVAPFPEIVHRDVATPKVEKDAIAKAIDGILEAHLKKFFDGLSADEQQKFIAEGETLTEEIVRAVRGKKTNFSEILDEITKWLHMLPMLNKDFLRQEAWIKTQAVMQFAQEDTLIHDLAA